MHNNLKSVVKFPNLKNRPKFLCIKKKKMKGSYNPGLGNVCDLLFDEFSSGMKERCLALLCPAGSLLGSSSFSERAASRLSKLYGKRNVLARPVGSEAFLEEVCMVVLCLAVEGPGYPGVSSEKGEGDPRRWQQFNASTPTQMPDP